jgi:hypothetical protein
MGVSVTVKLERARARIPEFKSHGSLLQVERLDIDTPEFYPDLLGYRALYPCSVRKGSWPSVLVHRPTEEAEKIQKLT